MAGLFEEAEMPIEKLMERYGAKNKSFEQLRDKGDSFQSPALRAKKGEAGAEATGNGCDDDIKVNIWKKISNGVKETGDGDSEKIKRAQLVNGDAPACAEQKTSKDVKESPQKSEGDNKASLSSGEAPTSSSSAEVESTKSDEKDAKSSKTENGSSTTDATETSKSKTETQTSSTQQKQEVKATSDEVTSSSASAAATGGAASSAESEAVAIGSVSSTGSSATSAAAPAAVVSYCHVFNFL